MVRFAAAVLASGLVLGVGATSVAYASGKPTVPSSEPSAGAGGVLVTTGGAATGTGTPTPGAPSTSQVYAQEHKAYAMSILAINQTFQASIASARVTFQTALGTATTSAERATARGTFTAAITAARVTRQAALTALGGLPTRP